MTHDIKSLFKQSAKLKRVKIDNRTKIVGLPESEIQDIKQDLDTQVVKGTKHEGRAKRELKRLGILHG